MAAVGVTVQATRLDDGTVTTQWGDIGSGPGGSIQGDWFYNDDASYARKGASSAPKGVYMSDNVDSDLTGSGTYEHVIIKYSTVTPGLLSSAATPGTRIYIGSASTQAGGGTDNNIYFREGNDTWPSDKAWIVLAIEPTITAYRDDVENSPNFSVTDYYGFDTDQTGASKDLNLTIGAVDIGNGLTMTGGDGGDADGTWQDFADADFGTSTNRYGFVQSSETPYFVIGTLIIGSATDTVFTDTGTVVIFDDALAAAGWNALVISLDTGNVYTETNGTFIGKGNTTTTDTRPTLAFIDAGGSSAVTGCNYTNFSTMALVVDVTWNDGTWVDSDQITMTGAPTVDGLTIINPTNDAAMVITAETSLDNMSNVTFDGAGIGGTADDAAIEINITGAGPHEIDLDHFLFENRVGSSVDLYFVDQGADRVYTVNVLNSGTNATFTKERAGDTVTVVSAVGYELTNIKNDTEITILDRAVELLDITGTPSDLSFGNVGSNERAGQSFEVDTAGKVERIRINIEKQGTPTDGIRIRVTNGVPGSTELLVSSYIDASEITTSFTEFDVNLDGKSSLATSTTYGIEIERSGAVDGSNFYRVEYSTSSVHSAGTRYVYNAGWGTAGGDILFTVMEAASDNQLYHVESVTSGTTDWVHDGTVREIEVLAMSIAYKAFLLIDNVGGSAKSVPISQVEDRVFSNPT